MRAPAFDALVRSDEPSLRYELRAHVLGENPESRAMLALRREVQRSPRVQALLAVSPPWRPWRLGGSLQRAHRK